MSKYNNYEDTVKKVQHLVAQEQREALRAKQDSIEESEMEENVGLTKYLEESARELKRQPRLSSAKAAIELIQNYKDAPNGQEVCRAFVEKLTVEY